MAIADSKLWRVHRSSNLPTLDAISADGYKNAGSEDKILMTGGEAPGSHVCMHFYGDTVPDNTDYPDTVAPIGSTFCYLTITSGVVAGAALYLKTAAATWTIFGSVT